MYRDLVQGKIILMYLIRCSSRFLAFVDLLGTTYSASTLATGYGAHIAQPLLRKSVEGREETLTEEEALKIIETSMRVLYYRDARSINKVNSFQPSFLFDLRSTLVSWFFSIKWLPSPIQVLIFPNLNSWKRHGRLQRVFEVTVVKLSDPLYSPRRCNFPAILNSCSMMRMIGENGR